MRPRRTGLVRRRLDRRALCGSFMRLLPHPGADRARDAQRNSHVDDRRSPSSTGVAGSVGWSRPTINGPDLCSFRSQYRCSRLPARLYCLRVRSVSRRADQQAWKSFARNRQATADGPQQRQEQEHERLADRRSSPDGRSRISAAIVIATFQLCFEHHSATVQATSVRLSPERRHGRGPVAHVFISKRRRGQLSLPSPPACTRRVHLNVHAAREATSGPQECLVRGKHPDFDRDASGTRY